MKDFRASENVPTPKITRLVMPSPPSLSLSLSSTSSYWFIHFLCDTISMKIWCKNLYVLIFFKVNLFGRMLHLHSAMISRDSSCASISSIVVQSHPLIAFECFLHL